MAVLVAIGALALPQSAVAQESAAVGTVYDKTLYERLVGKGMSRDEARCSSALAGATVKLERRTGRYFLPVDAGDPAISPNLNPQKTDEEGRYGWTASEGDYRVAVTKPGYWRLFSATVSDTSAVLDLDLPLKRRPGTPPPAPRDCEQAGAEPKPTDPGDHEPKEADDVQPTPPVCAFRPVNAGVRGRMVSRVVFTLNGRVIKRVRRPDADGRFGVTVDRRSLSAGKHVLRAKVFFDRRAKRRPESLRLVVRRCPERAAPKLVKASPPRCATRPFLAWVRGNRISRVSFRLNGRRLKTVSVADWRGRYGVKVRPRHLQAGPHEVVARVEFVPGSTLKQRTVRLRFRKCA